MGLPPQDALEPHVSQRFMVSQVFKSRTWVRVLSMKPALERIEKHLLMILPKQMIAVRPAIGDVCMVELQRILRRCLVLGIKGGIYSVRLIDIGSTMTACKVFELPVFLQGYPPMAYECMIVGSKSKLKENSVITAKVVSPGPLVLEVTSWVDSKIPPTCQVPRCDTAKEVRDRPIIKDPKKGSKGSSTTQKSLPIRSKELPKRTRLREGQLPIGDHRDKEEFVSSWIQTATMNQVGTPQKQISRKEDEFPPLFTKEEDSKYRQSFEYLSRHPLEELGKPQEGR